MTCDATWWVEVLELIADPSGEIGSGRFEFTVTTEGAAVLPDVRSAYEGFNRQRRRLLAVEEVRLVKFGVVGKGPRL